MPFRILNRSDYIWISLQPVVAFPWVWKKKPHDDF